MTLCLESFGREGHGRSYSRPRVLHSTDGDDCECPERCESMYCYSHAESEVLPARPQFPSDSSRMTTCESRTEGRFGKVDLMANPRVYCRVHSQYVTGFMAV